MHGLTSSRSLPADAPHQARTLGKNTICYVYPSGKVVVSPRQSVTEIAALESRLLTLQGDD
ncbi:hypothetical protein [Trichothermofontia sp.]